MKKIKNNTVTAIESQKYMEFFSLSFLNKNNKIRDVYADKIHKMIEKISIFYLSPFVKSVSSKENLLVFLSSLREKIIISSIIIIKNIGKMINKNNSLYLKEVIKSPFSNDKNERVTPHVGHMILNVLYVKQIDSLLSDVPLRIENVVKKIA